MREWQHTYAKVKTAIIILQLWIQILNISDLAEQTPTTELVFSDQEVADMATILVTKYGTQAINIAAFFLDEHLELQDHARAESWLRVMTFLDTEHRQSIAEVKLN